MSSVNNKKFHPIVDEILHMIDGVAGMRVHTNVTVHTDDRASVDAYETKIVFASRPTYDGVYKLGDLPVYVDDGYTSVYFGNPLDLYFMFKKDTRVNAWNVMRHLLPSPTAIYNGQVVDVPTVYTNRGACGASDLFVDTTAKPAVFDELDVLVG